MKKIFFVIICYVFTACNPICKDCMVAMSGQAYFPLEVGRFTEFDVAEQEYALGRDATTRAYQIKESVVEQYKDVSGQTVFRIVRYKRTNDTQRWQPDSTLTTRLSIDQAIRNESGRDYVKLVFPVAEKLTWNGNAYNNLGEDKYELKNINKPYQLGNQKFDNTITVIQQNDSTLVGQDKRLEVYANEIGLIYRESTVLQLCSSSPACVGKGQIDYGLKRVIKFARNGKE